MFTSRKVNISEKLITSGTFRLTFPGFHCTTTTRGFTIHNGEVSGRLYGFDLGFKSILEIGRIDGRPAVKVKWTSKCNSCVKTPMFTTIHEGNGDLHIANRSVKDKRSKHTGGSFYLGSIRGARFVINRV